MYAMECLELSKNYGASPILRGVSLGLRRGRVLGLLGPNGAGKSTLIKCMTGLVWPTSGQVKIAGFDVHGEHRQALAGVGAIIEFPNFHLDLTARQNLALLSGGYGARYAARLREITRLVNIDYALDARVRTFSTGMKQRLGIALALLPDSELVILDEPTNGLDPEGIVEIRTIIGEFSRQYGTTVLVSSHLLGEIEQICDDIAILDHGRIVAAGGLNELLTRAARLEIGVTRAAEALEFLEARRREGGMTGLREAVRTGPNELLLQLTAGTDPAYWAGELNTCLVGGGFTVTRLTERRYTLEEYFLSALHENGGAPCSE